MTQMIPLDSDHLIGFRIEGKVNEEDFDRVAGAIEDRLETSETVHLYVEISSLDGVPLKLWLKDFAFGLKHARHIDRIAVVTDRNWINAAVTIEGAIIPGVEARAFSFNEKVRAMDWLLARETA